MITYLCGELYGVEANPNGGGDVLSASLLAGLMGDTGMPLSFEV